MVTTAHRHAWFQAYIPPYGWINMEATEEAQLPLLGGTSNDWNLVVPLVEKENVKQEPVPFPWLIVTVIVLVLIGLIALGIVVSLYAVRYIKEIIYFIGSRNGSKRSVKLLGRLLMMRLAARGLEHKPWSMTFIDYSQRYPEISEFAALYDELLYRMKIPEDEKREMYNRLMKEYKKILNFHRSLGAYRVLYIFSLRGLRY